MNDLVVAQSTSPQNATPRLSVRWGFVDGVLGSSSYLDHFTAGFAEARLEKEVQVRKQRENGSSAVLGQALLDLAIIALLQGETQVTEACIKEALALAYLSDDILFQLLSYQAHSRFMQFQFSPSRRTLVTEELKAFTDFKAELPKWQAGITAAKSKLSNSSLCLLSRVLSLQRWTWSARSVQATLDDMRSSPGLFSASAEQDIDYFKFSKLDEPILQALRLDLADIYNSEGNPDKAKKIIADLITVSQERSLLGSCYATLGDWKVRSYSVPEVWNMIPLQGVNSNAQPREREWQEFKTEGLDIPGAKSEYSTAKQHFEAIGHERGLAAVELRLAYLNATEASTHPDKAFCYREALRHASSAQEKYSSAADWAGYYLACAHVELCRIGTGQTAINKDQALEIGRWGRTKGSWSFVLGIGLFIARYARRWHIAEGDYERSLAAFSLAEVLFSELGTPLSHAYSLTDMATAFETLGDRTRFFIMAQRALERSMQPVSAPFSGLERWLSANAEFIVNRMMIRAISLANPDDIDRAAKNARRLLEASSKSGAADVGSLLGLGTGSILAAFGLGQSYNGGMQQFKQKPTPRLLISCALVLSGLLIMGSGRLDVIKSQFKALSYKFLMRLMIHFKWAALMALFSVSLLTLSNPAETMISFLNRFQIEQTLHQTDVLGPLYRSRRVRRDGKRAKAEVDLEVEALIRQSGSALRVGGGFADTDMILAMSLSAEQLNFQEAGNICEAWFRRHELSLGSALKQPQGRDWRSLEQNQRRNHLLNGAQAFQRCRAYARASELLDQLKQGYGDEWWQQGQEPWSNLVLAGQVAEGLDQFESASSYYNRAAEVFEERRMQLTGDEYKMALSSNASAHETYFAASRAFLKWHRANEAAGTPSSSSILEQAFQASERGKARSLLDLVAGRTMIDPVDVLGDASFERYLTETMKLTTARALLAEAYSQEKVGQKMRDEMQKEVLTLEESVRSLELQRAEERGESCPLQINSQVITLSELTQQLPKDTLMLYFGYWSFDLVAWAVTQDGMVAMHHARRNNMNADLEYYAHRFRYLCEVERHDREGVAEWLTKTLLEPFSKLIQKHQHLIIVPHGSLHLVPFHALPFEGTVLCGHHTISYEPSASVFCRLSSINAKHSRILAIGNPANMQSVDKYTGERRTPGPLVNAELEAKYIVTMSPGSLSLTSNEATKEAVMKNLPNYDIVHLATHGDADADVALLSAVYLANGETLTVADLMSKRLRAKLVVISACRSGEGELAGGDEIMGFSRALLAAGVQSVVVSLWPVDDERTVLLMEQFYKSLLDGQPPAVALQTAQNTIRQYGEEEVEMRLLRIVDIVVKDATEKQSQNVAVRNVAGEDKGIEQEKVSQRAISSPRYWAPFIVIGR